LSIASAVGREFGLDVLEPLTGSPAEQLLEWLDEAIGARIVTKVPEAVGRHRFAHALVRETLYEEVSPAQRIRLHRQIGEVLENLHRARPERHVAEMAYHFAQAAEDGRDVDKAIGYARRAGERALVQLAYEEGARHYQAAVDLLAAHRPNDDATRADLLLGLGAARRRTGEIEKATAAIREAADTARRLGAPESLARAPLGSRWFSTRRRRASAAMRSARTPSPWRDGSAIRRSSPMHSTAGMPSSGVRGISTSGSRSRRRSCDSPKPPATRSSSHAGATSGSSTCSSRATCGRRIATWKRSRGLPTSCANRSTSGTARCTARCARCSRAVWTRASSSRTRH